MRKLFLVAIGVAVLAAAGVLLAQQKYPNLPDVPAVLDNDKVVVQRMDFEPGQWSGEHSHSGNQLVVILRETEMLYKEGDTETAVNYKPGQVFWIDAVTHDHKTVGGSSAVLITLK